MAKKEANPMNESILFMTFKDIKLKMIRPKKYIHLELDYHEDETYFEI